MAYLDVICPVLGRPKSRHFGAIGKFVALGVRKRNARGTSRFREGGDVEHASRRREREPVCGIFSPQRTSRKRLCLLAKCQLQRPCHSVVARIVRIGIDGQNGVLRACHILNVRRLRRHGHVVDGTVRDGKRRFARYHGYSGAIRIIRLCLGGTGRDAPCCAVVGRRPLCDHLQDRVSRGSPGWHCGNVQNVRPVVKSFRNVSFRVTRA